MNRYYAAALAACAWIAVAAAQDKSAPEAAPPGAPKSGKTRALETGAALLQNNLPVKGFDIYLVGFHPMKDKPEQQMEAHHYCHQMNQDFAQCVLFDSNTRDANMNGVEYIISEKLYQRLPEAERKMWHPHNGEILSGQLMAPGIPQTAERALMKDKMNSYGKTWHFWNIGHAGAPSDELPMGMPMLAWSFNRDGEIQPGLVEERDRRLQRDTARTREDRTALRELAKPQGGVDALKGQFARPSREIPGVTEP
ncbi:OBAP family protein [Oxalobacteraceae bacterium A2-2]